MGCAMEGTGNREFLLLSETLKKKPPATVAFAELTEKRGASGPLLPPLVLVSSLYARNDLYAHCEDRTI